MPYPYDPMNYESLAWNLAQGNGFGHSWGNAEFQAPYLERARRADPWVAKGYEHYFFQRHSDGTYVLDEQGQRVSKPDAFVPTAYVPLGMPGLMAVVYKVTDRAFWAWRLLECAMLAGAVAAMAWLAGWWFGRRGVVLLTGVAVIDPALWYYAGAFMTEPPAILLTAVFTALLVVFRDTSQRRYLLAACLTYGLMMVFRNMFVLWSPLTALLIAWIWHTRTRPQPTAHAHAADASPQPAHVTGEPKRRRKHHALVVGGLFVTLALTIPMPWFVRNVQVLDAFMPLGTQGGIGMPGGYGEPAMTGQPLGRWVWPGIEFFRPARDPLMEKDVPGIYFEREEARFGQQYTRQWVRDHPWLTLRLMAAHLQVMWNSRWVRLALIMTVVSLTAAFWLGLRRGTGVLWVVLAINCLAVTLTYAAGEGRFLMPVLPAIYLLFVAALLALHAKFSPRLQRLTQTNPTTT